MEVIELVDGVKLYKVGIMNYYYFEKEKVLFEAGLTCSASKLLEEFDEEIEYVVVPHGHFDHVAGLSVLLEQYPEARVVVHENLAKLFEKEKVKASWVKDDRELCKKAYGDEYNIEFSGRVDVTVREGDEVNGLEVIESFGHSKDAISLYSRKHNVLLASDYLGYVTSSGKVIPMYFADFNEYVKTLEKLAAIKPYVLGLSHNRYFVGKEVDRIFEIAKEETIKLAEKVKEMSDDELFKYFYVEEVSLYPEDTMKLTATMLKKRVLERG